MFNQFENPFAPGGIAYGFNPVSGTNGYYVNAQGQWIRRNPDGSWDLTVQNPLSNPTFLGNNNNPNSVYNRVTGEPVNGAIGSDGAPIGAPPSYPSQPAPANPVASLPQQPAPAAAAPFDFSKLSAMFPGSGAINYGTSIQAGPVWPQQDVNNAAGAMQRMAAYQSAQPVQMKMGTPGMNQAAGAYLQDATRGQMGDLSQQFSRDASYANAQQQLASEKARAASGAQNAQLALGQQQLAYSPLMTLLGLFQ